VNRQIRRLGIALVVCYVILFAQLNWLQVFHAEALKDNPNNTRTLLRDFSQPRGTITTADGAVVAKSVPSNDKYERQRQYPLGDLFAHSVGYFSLNLGSTGVEKSYNTELAGRTLDLQIRSLSDLFVDRERVGNVTLTLRRDLQQLAKDQLGNRPGSVVALDPRNGNILALWSYPAFDPNAFASHDFEAAAKAKQLVDAAPGHQLLAKTYQERFFPGSTFKVVTATAGLNSGKVTKDQPSYPVRTSYQPPQTNKAISNFGGESCGGTLFEILRVSCNSAFAQMAVDLGPEQMISTAHAFGFDKAPPIDLPRPAPSNFPNDFRNNIPALALSGIGQYDVSATPLEMALVAAAVANKGTIMTPHVMQEIRDDRGDVTDRYDPKPWLQPTNEANAEIMRQAMLGDVQSGTATALKTPGLEVGGKTGTAQLGTQPPRSHAWIISFAGPPGGAPEIVVAVIVEGQEGSSEQTGGRVAAPIAQAIIAAALKH
jgi:peptidoglycan glycosyltransferase